MIPIRQPWTNVVMGEGQEHVLPCPAHRDPKTGDVTVAWQLTDEEIIAVINTKTIFSKHYTYRNPMQPVQLWASDENGNAVPDDRM